MRILTISMLLLALNLAWAESDVVNVYNWSGYIAPSIIQRFEHQTGIEVHYATFDDNQSLLAQLKANPDTSYDVIFPSSYYVSKMRRAGMLHKIDHKRLHYYDQLRDQLLNRQYDPQQQYSIPYLWGTTGIIVNDRTIDPDSATHWHDLWDKRFRHELLLLDDVKDAFAMAFLSMDQSINQHNRQAIKRAYHRLKNLLPNVKLFNSEATIPIFIDGDAAIGMILNGDAYKAHQQNPHLHYIYPQEGVMMWIDCMAIPKNAPHLDNAYRFINFLMQPKIAKLNSLKLGYSTPSKQALQQMPASIRHNKTMNPPPSILKRAYLETNPGQAMLRLMNHLWNRLKIAA